MQYAHQNLRMLVDSQIKSLWGFWVARIRRLFWSRIQEEGKRSVKGATSVLPSRPLQDGGISCNGNTNGSESEEAILSLRPTSEWYQLSPTTLLLPQRHSPVCWNWSPGPWWVYDVALQASILPMHPSVISQDDSKLRSKKHHIWHHSSAIKRPLGRYCPSLFVFSYSTLDLATIPCLRIPSLFFLIY